MLTFTNSYRLRTSLLVLIYFCAFQAYAQVPSITSFSPLLAPSGNVITISGTNFNDTLSKNIVYFGGIRANVTAASTTSLSVQVPVGAPNERISVTANGKTAVSTLAFGLVFPGGTISSTSYLSPSTYILRGGNVAFRPLSADLDGDGLPELISTGGTTNGGFYVARNISTPGNISFSAPQSYTTITANYGAVAADVDGDGLLDLLFGSTAGVTNIIRNTSTPGIISFAAPISITSNLTSMSYAIDAGDLNNDGLPELVFTHTGTSFISVFQNNSTVGNISFMPYVNFTVSPVASVACVYISDLDKNGYNDIIVSGSNAIATLRNTSSPSSISFENPKGITGLSNGIQTIKVKDLNGDLFPDVLLGVSQSRFLAFENSSVNGSINLGTAQMFYHFGNSIGFDAEDVNGDGLTDVIVMGPNYISIFQNTGVKGSIQSGTFFTPVDYYLGSSPYSHGGVMDLDKDGRKDIYTSLTGSGNYQIRRFNNICQSPLIYNQPKSFAGCAGLPVTFSADAAGNGTVTYQWRKNGVAINGANNPSYSISSMSAADTGTYTLVVSDSCVTNGLAIAAVSTAARLMMTGGPFITSNPVPVQVCGGLVSFSVDAINAGNMKYQWRKNGVDINGATNAVYSILNASAADSGNYSVVLTDTCGQATSASAALTIIPIITPDVTDITACSPTSSYILYNNASVPLGYDTKWYDDAGCERLIGNGYSMNKIYPRTDTVYVRHEYINTNPKLVGVSTIDNLTLAGDDRSALAITQRYLYYTGDSYTARYEMPGLTNGISLPGRDALISTYGGSGSLYSLGNSSTPWGYYTTGTTTHIWQMDSALNAIPGSAVALNGIITSLGYGTGRFIASGPDFFLYRLGATIYKINPLTGLTSLLSTTANTFTPSTSEGWCAWGHVELVNNNHYIYFKSTAFPQGVSRYHVESNTTEPVFNPGSLAVFNDMSALLKSPWNNKWYFKFEAGTVTTGSSGIDEVIGYCDDPVRLEATPGCVSPLDTVIVTSTIPAFGTPSQTINACSGSSTTISYTVTPSTGLSYYWYKNGSYIASTSVPSLSINPLTFADSGKYVLSIYNGCVSYNSDTTYLNVKGVNIVAQPQHKRNCQGEAVSLSVTATGSGTVAYQWRKNNVNINGATAATYNIAALAPSDTGSYTVVISDSCNTGITSDIAQLSISTGPAITFLSTNTTACLNNQVILSVLVNGNGNILYQWRKNGIAITNANAATYTITNFAASDAGTYSVVINDNCGQTTSANISLTQQVITAPSVIDRTFCSSSTSLTHTNTASTPSGYVTRWYEDDSLKLLIGTGSSLNRFYTSTDTIYARNEPASAILSGAYAVEHDPYSGDDRGGIAVTQSYYYYVGDGGTVRLRMPGLTNPTTLTVRDGIIATYGGTGTVYSLGSSSGPWQTNSSGATHIWQLDSNLAAVPGSGIAFNGVLATLSTSGGLMVSGEDYILYHNPNNGYIYKIIPSTGVVSTLTTSSFNLARYATENWAGWAYAEKSGANHYITYRSSDGNLSKFHVEGNTTQAVFTEYPNSLSDMGCISYAPWFNRVYYHHEGSSSLTASGFYETAGYCDFPMRYANTGCFSAVDTIYIISNSPVIFEQPQSQNNCAGSLSRFIVRSSGTGLSYQWQKNGVNIPGATNDTLSIPVTAASDTGNYTVIVSNSCNSTISTNARLNVKGVNITAHPANIRNCLGEPVSLTITASGTGTITYQWRKNGSNLPGATSASYNIAALSPLDTGTYTVIVTDSCNVPVSSLSAYVSISSGPSISNLSPAAIVCRGSSTTLSATVNGNGTITYQWRKNGTPVPGANASSYTINNLSPADTANYTLAANDNCGQSISTAVNISLLIVAAPEVNNNSVCNAGNSVSLTNTVPTPPGYTTRWYDNAAMTVLLGSGPLLVRTINAPDTFYVRNENATCVSATDTVYVTVTSSNTWTGASNTNWFNATNWSCGVVPNASSNALIPAGTANSPIINNGLTANVNSLNIASGATVSMLGISSINIYGTLTRTGVLSCPAGTVNYASTTTAITIAGGDYYNLSVAANSNGATLTGSVKLYNTFIFNGNTLVKLDTCTLTQYNYTSSAVTGAGTSAYFVTNKTGRLRLAGVGNGAASGTSAFAYIGNSTYNPVGITNSGTMDTFTFRVIDSVTTLYSGSTPAGTKITSNVVNRSWIISEETTGGSALTIVPGWIIANETPSFNRSNCYISRFGPVTWVPNAAGAAAPNGSVYFRSQTGITSTGVFGVGSNGALPVELLNFTAKKQHNHVAVNWSTASETNNNYFVVEVSADMKTFVRLEQVKGNGTSNNLNEYAYLHTGAAEFASANHTNTLYYRLRQVDFDGSEYETEVAPVSFVKTSYQVSVSPNPFVTEAMVSFNSDAVTDATITVTDVNGKQVSGFSRRINGTGTVKLEGCEALSAGVYFVRIVTTNGEVNTFKLIKQ